MTATDPVATRVAHALHEGLDNAQRFGRSTVAAEHLRAEQFAALAADTLAHLRATPGKPSDIEGWLLVTARDAAVMTWWADVASLTEGERRRLSQLRTEVYDVLAERNVIQRGAGRSTSIHVSPAESSVEPEAAWVLKLSPYLYDANRVFVAPDRRVHAWSVEDQERAASMREGDRVYFWLGEGDPYRAAGVWGVGRVTGPTVLGVADDGWLDYEAASRVHAFAVVDVTLLDAPVSRYAFLDDPRLAEAEVIRDPYAANPAVLSASEEAALTEYLATVGAQSESTDEPQVA